MPDPTVRLDYRPDGVAVLTFDQPGSKANVLTPQVWSDFEAALDQLAARADVRGLVLASAKPGIFIAGADLKLLGPARPSDPAVRGVIEQGLRVLAKLEALPFPTCAAIDGAALGGGLEVALACDSRHYGNSPRIQVGFPEVTLGLIPGWGGTQRLPRIIGMETAARLLASGEILDVRGAAEAGLAEEITESDGLTETVANTLVRKGRETLTAFIRERRVRKQSPIPVGERTNFRETMPSQPTATREAVAVLVQGAGLPLADAIKLETEAFLRLAGSDESKRLIAEFFASRQKA
jgi:enoyl-CoA hydratase/carnithine racemase